jgi:hypothetical protein
MAKEKNELEQKVDIVKKKQVCGIVMPISAIDGCPEAHWADVLQIISSAIYDANFEPNLVSNADDIGVIQKRIIQNLYDNPIVVCDVSGKNANVMFELGMRLAFDRATIIIIDDKTTFSFDTQVIEHIVYPRDLRFNTIVEFRKKLTERILKTYEKSIADPDYSTFLKHFGEFTVAKIDQKEVSGQEYLLEEIRSLKALFVQSQNRIVVSPIGAGGTPEHLRHHYRFTFTTPTVIEYDRVIESIKPQSMFKIINANQNSDKELTVDVLTAPNVDLIATVKRLEKLTACQVVVSTT